MTCTKFAVGMLGLQLNFGLTFWGWGIQSIIVIKTGAHRPSFFLQFSQDERLILI